MSDLAELLNEANFKLQQAEQKLKQIETLVSEYSDCEDDILLLPQKLQSILGEKK